MDSRRRRAIRSTRCRGPNTALYRRYEALARTRSDVVFAGRLGTYQYFNMDQVVGQALAIHRRLVARAGAAEAAAYG